MDAARFLGKIHSDRPKTGTLFWGIGNWCCGLALFGVAARFVEHSPWIAGWLGMTAVVLSLHFGFFAVLAWVWRQRGVDATPVMNTPLAATSLAEFWGTRWNTAFHHLVHRYVFRPSLRQISPSRALLLAFVVSGLVHDLIISVPARAGFGFPTLYFVLQGVGVLFERNTIAQRIGLGRGKAGWLFTLVVAVGPAFLLFHPPFIRNVILPFLRALGM